MTVEQKAQRYDKALEKAKEVYTYYCDDREQLRKIESIFPELKESEDEKIREALIRFHKSTIDVDGIRGEDIIAWLEKQGNTSNKATYTQEVEIGNGNIKGLVTEEIPIDKIEPKFKVGDWVVDNHGEVNQVTAVTDDDYGFALYDGTYVSGCWKDYYHLWTIQDAKNGDILNSPSHNLIWIYKDNENYHICVNMNYVPVNISTDGLIAIPSDACPATKDERTILFANMKKAGYEWDAEMKELKKIDNEEVNGEDYGIDGLYHAQSILEKTLGKVDGYQSDDGILEHKAAITAVKKLYEQKPSDNKKLDILKFIRKETHCGLADANNALLKLIKVLKERPLPIMDKPYKLKIEWEKQQ